MPVPLLLDSNILSTIVRPAVAVEEHEPVATAIDQLLQDARFAIYVPEIVDYELRRKLLHVGHRRHQGRKWALEALAYLDDLVSVGYIPNFYTKVASSCWHVSRNQDIGMTTLFTSIVRSDIAGRR